MKQLQIEREGEGERACVRELVRADKVKVKERMCCRMCKRQWNSRYN